MVDFLAKTYPLLGRRLPKVPLADLPTPVTTHRLALPSGSFDVAVKHDEATSRLYGGNKVRKLEYLLKRAIDQGAQRVATFGAAGSNHALATAMHARELGLECTCFLSHQSVAPNVARTLNMHQRIGTEIVHWRGGADKLNLFRKHLQGRNTWVIPLGGTCWRGSVGFVNAGLELAAQISDGSVERPDRIYVACGTTGSAAGLALGIAAAGLDTVVHAVQVADNPFASEAKMHKLIAKTQFILKRLDPAFSGDGWHERIVWRDEFLAGGYARIDDATVNAVATAKKQLELDLETTYTGKAMAALLHDLVHDAEAADVDCERCLFWNTYNAAPLSVSAERPQTFDGIPDEFERYYSHQDTLVGQAVNRVT
jgi:D-cysteine desulfhydrase